ncbi:hypothetical protein [Caudoviricetes sp.]|nr:hypothetical protein [Caudoviricetes sp.]
MTLLVRSCITFIVVSSKLLQIDIKPSKPVLQAENSI